MRDNKSKSSLLERKRFIFLEIVAIIALAAVLVAFNYRSYRNGAFLDFDRIPDRTIEEFPRITKHPDKPIPPAPPPPTTLFNLLDGEIKVETDYNIDVEANQNAEVGYYVPFIPEEIADPKPEPYVRVEILPFFPGGETARKKFFRDNVTFPMSAWEIGVSEPVYIQFVVEPDGRVTNVKVLQAPGRVLNQEVVRVCLPYAKLGTWLATG